MFHNIVNSHGFEKYLPASKSIPLLRTIQVNIKTWSSVLINILIHNCY